MVDNKNGDGSQAATPMADTQLDQVSGGGFVRIRCRIVCLECGWESSWGTDSLVNSQWADHAAATGHSRKHMRTDG